VRSSLRSALAFLDGGGAESSEEPPQPRTVKRLVSPSYQPSTSESESAAAPGAARGRRRRGAGGGWTWGRERRHGRRWPMVASLSGPEWNAQ
jgi:hypothetical protein